MRLRLHQELGAARERVWPYVTEPELINRWSTAAVQPLMLGDQGRASTVGTLRRVRVPARPRPLVFEEVVEHADAPRRFVYRLVGQRIVRHHLGEITLRRSAGDRTLLVWEVEFDFAVGALETAVRATLVPQLQKSLSRLDETMRAAPSEERAAEGRLWAEDPSEAFAAASRVRDEQEVLADELRQRGDPRHWFARVYQHVTARMLDACGPGGTVTHKGWALRLVPGFHDYYTENLKPGQAEPHWQRAFDAIGRAEGSSAMAFWAGIVEGARAHIEGDLPRVLADTYLEYYADRCDYARFRADFLLMAPLFGQAWNRLAEDVPPAFFPAWLRTIRRTLPPEAVEAITARRYYDPGVTRRAAFERGRELVEYVRARPTA